MKRQQIPLLLMLIAGAITSLTVYFRGLGLKTMLIALLAAMVAFYFLGTIIKMLFDSYDKKNADRDSDGEVIEKESDETVASNSEAESSRDSTV